MQTTLYPHIYAPRVPGMSRSRVLSTLELTQVRDLETLDVGVRELLQTCPNVPCNALLTAGYAIFKRECARRVAPVCAPAPVPHRFAAWLRDPGHPLQHARSKKVLRRKCSWHGGGFAMVP